MVKSLILWVLSSMKHDIHIKLKSYKLELVGVLFF